MQVADYAHVVEAILHLQSQAADLGLMMMFAERPSPNGLRSMAVVIDGPDREEHAFFSFTEASAFLQGLSVARRRVRGED